jgi:hypothetical protein
MCVLFKIARRMVMKRGQLVAYLKSIARKFKLLLKEEIQMADMYVALIMNKRRTIDQVPAQWKDPVMADLTALGMDGYGNPLSAEPVKQ